MKELTKGYPAKVILLFAVPIICGNIFQQLYNIVDSKIVSTYVSTEAFAAIGATAVISNTLIGFINGLTQGFAIPIANSFGARDEGRMRKYVAGTIRLTIGIAVSFTILSQLAIHGILSLLDTPEDIFPFAMTYVRVILSGIIFTALYNMCANVLRAVGDSKTPLYCLLTAVAINVGLDFLFVCGLGKGIAGAAYATIISQAISGLMCLVYILWRFREILPKREDWKLESGQYSELLTSGLAMGLMSCIVNIGTVVLQGAINSLGTDYVAAHAAARRVFDILTVSMYSIAVGMTTYTSQNVGAGKMDRVKQGIRHALVMEIIITSVLIVICYAFARPVYEWLTNTDNQNIINTSVQYSKISILFFYVLGPLFILRCSLQGMGRKMIPVMSSVLEMVIKVLSATFLVPAFGYMGVIFTEPISWIFMLGVLTFGYFKAKKELLD